MANKIIDSDVKNIIAEKGVLRFSTLMVRFHVSSNEAMAIVENYRKRGIIDENGKQILDAKTKTTEKSVSKITKKKETKNTETKSAIKSTQKSATKPATKPATKTAIKMPGSKKKDTLKKEDMVQLTLF